MDRNQRARDDFRRTEELAKMQRQFAQAVATGQVKVLDRFAKTIEKGSLVVWKTPHDMLWLVTDVKPVLAPNAPPGVVSISLTATVPESLCRVNSPIMEMIVVGQQPKGETPQLVDPGPPTPPTETAASSVDGDGEGAMR